MFLLSDNQPHFRAHTAQGQKRTIAEGTAGEGRTERQAERVPRADAGKAQSG